MRETACTRFGRRDALATIAALTAPIHRLPEGKIMNTAGRIIVKTGADALLTVPLAGCASSSGRQAGDEPSATPSKASSAAPSSASSPSSDGSGSTSTTTITVKNFTYSGPSSVAPGTEITVKNEDSTAHTVTADNLGAFDVQVTGSYPFHCTYYSNMHDTLEVG